MTKSFFFFIFSSLFLFLSCNNQPKSGIEGSKPNIIYILADDLGYGAVLMIVPEGEQHTLGPMVAMGQLRRMGLSVCLRIAPNVNELSHLLQHRDFNGVLISVATEARLKSVTTLIRVLRSLKLNVPPIVLGGPIVYENPHLAALTGADYSGVDIASAMEAIGLTVSTQDILRRA
jgi:methylmalonyl-CoA mutase cobalamin-binding subunit